MGTQQLLIYDSVTKLGPDACGQVVIAASHGGRYAAYLAAVAGVKGIILNDAGFGCDNAGIGGMALLQECGIASATVSHASSRIGDGKDAAMRGRISAANEIALALGVIKGMPACDAASRMVHNPGRPVQPPALLIESRTLLPLKNGKRVVVLIDSASLVQADDRDAIVITGSHGGLLGGNPAAATKYPVFAALYNDAGIGIDCAGMGRLRALDAQGIIGATVDAYSARIGDARSSYEQGVLSAINKQATRIDLHTGMTVRDCVLQLQRI